METIIDTGTYTNNPSGHFHPDEHMRLISQTWALLSSPSTNAGHMPDTDLVEEHMRLLTQTRALRSSPSTNASHMPDTDLVEVSDWSRQGTSSAGDSEGLRDKE